eukprot:jgi/Chlat1/2906/Chrsp2S04656
MATATAAWTVVGTLAGLPQQGVRDGGARRWRQQATTMTTATASAAAVCFPAQTITVPPVLAIGDRLLDYIEGGPKLRKWYGASEEDNLPMDGEEEEQEPEEDPNAPRDAVVVTGADSASGELVVLQLVLARKRVRALVKDAKSTSIAFGPYVKPFEGDEKDVKAISTALKNARAVICCGKVGKVAEVAAASGVEHVIMLSASPAGFSSLFGGDSRKADEGAIAAATVPYTIVRVGKLLDQPGGMVPVTLSQGRNQNLGSVSREDVAKACVRALEAPPQHGLTFEVVTGQGTGETDWDSVFENLQESVSA